MTWMQTLRTIALTGLLIGLALAAVVPNSTAARDKQSAAPFIVFASVFNESGFAVEGAEARLRRAGEKKDRWQARSDRRGEFAMRVPPGAEYELTVSAKGYRSETQKVDARQTNRVDLTLHLVTASKDKKAEEKPGKAKPAQEKPPEEENR